jgi:hypothetical protein
LQTAEPTLGVLSGAEGHRASLDVTRPIHLPAVGSICIPEIGGQLRPEPPDRGDDRVTELGDQVV